MKRSLVSTLAICGGGLLGLAASRLRPRPQSPGDAALNRLTTYFIVPVWISAGFLDYIWHRRTRIETTSGIEESLMHSLMMLEAGPAVLAPLFLEINAGVLGGMVALGVAHELTVLWDVYFTSPRRPISAGEQVTHTFLEAPPFLVAAAAIATHWEQFQALFHRGKETARYDIRLRDPLVPLPTLLLVACAVTLFGALPHFDELRRCVQAMKAGEIGQDSPACLEEVFS
jgi:hypothetical protein